MENDDTDALSTGDPLSGPKFDGNGYDTKEEVLLLQVMEETKEGASPNLQAVLDDRVDLGWPSAQRQQSSLLMERPQSPGIDTSTFSFAKAVQNGKPFSLQPALRHPTGANHEKPGQDRGLVRSNSDEGSNQARASVRSRTRSAEFSENSHNVDPSSVTTNQRKDKGEHIPFPAVPNTDARTESRTSVDFRIGQTVPSQPGPQCKQSQLSSEHPIRETSSSQLIHDQLPSQSHNGDKGLNRLPSFERLDLGQNDLSVSRLNTDQWKIVKRRHKSHSDKRRATTRVSYAPSDTSLQVPEEVLFQQLIGRLRAREESEAVASNLQKEMEANMTALREENNVLKEELQLMGRKLQKRTTEARAYKLQTDSWKSKLAKVKIFLNELGAGYQNLRGEAIHFKATRKSLDKEHL
ncbi:hypothetical protein BDW62DRAFT_164706 [Aspergillus aurantiobrunneus]